jgi:rubredoxin
MASQPACPICASPTREVLWPAAVLPDTSPVVRCNSCGFIYRTDAASRDHPRAEWTDAAAFEIPDVSWRERLGVLEETVGGGAILNIGGGPPSFMRLAREEG